ncbi:nuclear egress membrane protein [Macropodid alphaherpesvirus 1]|uniref:Nuclear egress membrane protein n=1 Tax=Macropodid alphaherpesvirus 1 TaxID=137443 RepID=A0A109QII2_9ALPH|nr:nuclear egress membrane protein [Macropodid alphaherpesvirus 1]AMB17047.1 nuclear egress membrane protein [Macropodid alphaherpesvirus 1]
MSSYQKTNAFLQENTFDGLLYRIRSVAPTTMQAGVCGGGTYTPTKLPTQSIFQLYSFQGDGDTFLVEYVLSLMKAWAAVECNPYIRIQNTGVSILFEGFFDPPYDTPTIPATRGMMNVSLAASETTGISLRDIHSLKTHSGVDSRPMMAQLGAMFFIRTSHIQIAFRFLGPDNKDRVKQLVKLSGESFIRDHDLYRRRRRLQDSEEELSLALREMGNNQQPPSAPSKLTEYLRSLRRRLGVLCQQTWLVPVGGLLIGGIFWGAVSYGYVPAIKPTPPV